uniref:WAP domain-containing protein n=1 Tax=Amphilophus citrinellus TaxID=61819 RepID=A0A3Q0SVT0_AMPCI
MDKHWSTVCALIAAFCALVHFGTVFSEDPTAPGVCPHRIYVHANCVEDCYSDSDCPNNEKCCPNGCGHECMPAPGVCPRRYWDFIGCVKLCSNDGDCPKKEKCCSTGCGRACMAPNTGVR